MFITTDFGLDLSAHYTYQLINKVDIVLEAKRIDTVFYKGLIACYISLRETRVTLVKNGLGQVSFMEIIR